MSTQTIREFELEAMGRVSVKSLYGRAKVRVYGNTGLYSLLSYGVEVAAGTMATRDKAATLYRIYDEEFEADRGGWSSTTAKHLESFAAFLGTTYGNKAQWKAREYTTIPEVLKALEGYTKEKKAA